MPPHECPTSIRLKFKIEQVDGSSPWHIYDRMTHAYIFGIIYCPFCGDKLD